MSKIVYTLAIVILLSIFRNSYALDLSPEHEITEIARARCSSELKKGQDYETNVLANGNVEFKLLGKKGGALDGTFIYNKREWEEQQKVLIEHQLTRDSNHTACVLDQSDKLRKTYVKNVVKVVSPERKLVTQDSLKIGVPYECIHGGVLSGTHKNGTSDTWDIKPNVKVLLQVPHATIDNVKYVRILLDKVTIANTNGVVGLRNNSVNLFCYE